TVFSLLLAGLAAAPVAHAADAGALWSVPFEPVSASEPRAERLAARAFAHDGHMSDDGASEDDGPTGTVAATTPEVETDRFEVAAVSWLPDAEDAVTRVAVRVRDTGSWTEWFELGVVDSGEPDERVGSEPVIAADGSAVQAVVQTVTGKAPEGL